MHNGWVITVESGTPTVGAIDDKRANREQYFPPPLCSRS